MWRNTIQSATKSVSIGPISQQTVRFDGRCEAVAVARPLWATLPSTPSSLSWPGRTRGPDTRWDKGPAVSSQLSFDARASLVVQSVAYESTVASMAPGGLQYLLSPSLTWVTSETLHGAGAVWEVYRGHSAGPEEWQVLQSPLRHLHILRLCDSRLHSDHHIFYLGVTCLNKLPQYVCILLLPVTPVTLVLSVGWLNTLHSYLALPDDNSQQSSDHLLCRTVTGEMNVTN